MSESVKIPAEHVVAVADIIRKLATVGGVTGPVDIHDLHVAATANSLELVDPSGTYGIRRWSSI